jgi:glycosyltransferase involved in cell wall biosynthesis
LTEKHASGPTAFRARLRRSSAGGARTAWLISYSVATDEPRLIRKVQTLLQAGWRVVVCAYEGERPVPADWTFVSLANSSATGRWTARRMEWQRRVGTHLARLDLPADALKGLATQLISSGLPNWHRDHREILRIASENPDLKPDVVIAHNYYTCPPGWDLARHHGAAFLIDSQEYMLGVMPDSPRWVREQRPFIKAAQDYYFARADQVFTVSQGIADRLTAEQRLKRPAKVMRNVPPYAPYPFRPVSGARKLLYHGLIDPARDLDLAVRAAALWTSATKLIIRGPSEGDTAGQLAALAAELGVAGKVAIEPAVPFAEMLARANGADIGYFVYRDGSPQRRFVLPNKFFEYQMAGLALMISDLPEMAALTLRYDTGVIVGEVTPEAIARAVDSLTDDQINTCKANALKAAQSLCWEKEQGVLLETLDEVCRPA